MVAVDNKTYKTPVAPTCKIPPCEILANRDRFCLRSSSIIEARGNKFVAHMATISSPEDIATALNVIKYTYHVVSTATHNMYGARIKVGRGIHEYFDDDGEFGGAREIMNVLKAHDVTDKLVVITRWTSGIQLGHKRFSIIASCVGNVVRPTPNNTGSEHSSPERMQHPPRPNQQTRDSVPHDVTGQSQTRDHQPLISNQETLSRQALPHDVETGVYE